MNGLQSANGVGQTPTMQPESGILLEKIHNLIGELENKLSPVLRQSTQSKTEKVPLPSSALMTELDNVTMRLLSILDRLDI